MRSITRGALVRQQPRNRREHPDRRENRTNGPADQFALGLGDFGSDAGDARCKLASEAELERFRCG